MKVIVCGSHKFGNEVWIWRCLDLVHSETPITALMQGGAEFVDRFASTWAKTKPGIQRYVCKAEWNKYGMGAGPIRNTRMLGWKPDLVIAFPGANGTADMVRKAERAGIQVRKFE